MNIPDTIYYTKDHEWIKIENGDIAIVGITDFAQGELGDIVYVDINSIGKSLKSQDVFGTIEAVKTVSDLFLPIDATIHELNPELTNNPQLVNEDPYGKGWLVRIKCNNPKDIEALMDANAYKNIIAG